MNIKCNVNECELNKEHKCTLDAIEINFCNDEYRFAECSSFKESKAFKQQHYKIMPISIIPDYKYIIFSTSSESVSNYLKSIIEDLKMQYNETEKVNVLIDNLLHNGAKASNRYFKCTIDFNENNENNDDYIVTDSLKKFKIYNTPQNSELRKFSANFYKNRQDLIEYSILTLTQKKMILKGLAI